MSLDAHLRDALAAAGHAGATLADLLPAAAPLVDAARADKAAARLRNAGHRDPDGRRRVVQERLNTLVHRGHATARGEGDARRFFTTDTPTGNPTMTDRPKPKRQTLPLDSLTFAPEHQQRAGLGKDGYSPAAVEEYAERIEGGAELPAVRVVSDGETHWVIGGWHTAKALARAGRTEAECLVYPGTFEDATFWALAENSDQSVLPRTNADKQKALTTLLSSPKLIARVQDSREPGDGGIYKAIARACGVSHGMVCDALKARGLRATKSGRLVKDDGDKKPAAPSTPAPPAPEPSPAPGEADPAPTTARHDPAADRSPGAGEAEAGGEVHHTPPAATASPDPTPGVPAWVRAAVADRPKWDTLVKTLTACLHDLDRLASGPAGVFVRKVLVDGSPFVHEMPVRRGQVTSTVYTLPEVIGLIRLLKRARPDKVCGGCGGTGCGSCRDAGFLPANLNLLPTAGETGDLFDAAELRDVWDAA